MTEQNKAERVLIVDDTLQNIQVLGTVLRELQYQINAEHRANQAMLQEIRALKNDPSAIEKLAREELNMVRPDETIYFLPSGPRPQADDSAEAEKDNEPGSPTAPFRPNRH